MQKIKKINRARIPIEASWGKFSNLKPVKPITKRVFKYQPSGHIQGNLKSFENLTHDDLNEDLNLIKTQPCFTAEIAL
jgi:hypothetical protein